MVALQAQKPKVTNHTGWSEHKTKSKSWRVVTSQATSSLTKVNLYLNRACLLSFAFKVRHLWKVRVILFSTSVRVQLPPEQENTESLIFILPPQTISMCVNVNYPAPPM